MDNNVASLGQGPGLAWKRGSSSFPPGSLAELQDWTGGKTEPVGPSWPDDLVFTQWNTIGWAITDDGVLCIKPWEGDTGETGAVISADKVPWRSQRTKIKKVESIGTIVLNAKSSALFHSCSSLTSIAGIANWNTSNVTDMGYMFYKCSSLPNLTALANWDVSNVTSMESMFNSCSSLPNLTALANWDVSNVTSMYRTFTGCSSLTDLTPLERWNVSNVKIMDTMFYNCSKLTALTALKDWSVSNVKSMVSMFYGCSNLTDLTSLSSWDVSNVTSMNYMFSDCSNLTDLTSLSSWDVSNVTSMNYMFSDCSKIQKIGIPSIENGGQKLVANAKSAELTKVLPSIVSEDGSMGPLTWNELKSEMTSNPERFESGTVWVKAEEAE